jgi:hypothetical protein
MDVDQILEDHNHLEETEEILEILEDNKMVEDKVVKEIKMHQFLLEIYHTQQIKMK